MIAAKIQLRQRELKKFIIVANNGRSERIGVIHDDDVPNVNRKTTARNSTAQQFDSPMPGRRAQPTNFLRWIKELIPGQLVPIITRPRFITGFAD
jgi:hypothetical protein